MKIDPAGRLVAAGTSGILKTTAHQNEPWSSAVIPSFRRFLLTLGALTGLGTSLCTEASSPEAWATHKAEVVAKCALASGLKNAKLVGELIEYDDRLGLTAALIAGVYPQQHMRNQTGRSLCVFDRRTRMAFAAPADSWK